MSYLVLTLACLLLFSARVSSFAQSIPLERAKPAAQSSALDARSKRVWLDQTARDESAGGLDCYKIETPTATYYLDKVGAGLSSMIDRDGNDWLGFHPQPGSGAAGEYRGFPNAVFREAGSYFHARNSGTDPCVTIVEEATPQRIVISALSDNGLWAGKSSPESSRTFAEGLRRPVDLRFAPDGSLLVLLRNAWVVDDKFEGGTGALMRISYHPRAVR